jgi:hypothetical protein
MMNWIDLKNKIYYEDGSLRDLYVSNTNSTDWKKWTVYVNHRYKIHWFNTKTNGNQSEIDFAIVEEQWNVSAHMNLAKIYIDNLQINAHFFVDNEIENNIDPKELNSVDDHDKLLNYMKDISILLEKEVILTPENSPEIVLIRVNGRNVEFI